MNDDPAIAAAFLNRWLDDVEQGRIRDLASYQAEFAGHDDLIAREFEALTAAAPPTGDTDDGGRRVGKYRLQRELGRGAQGVVWLAEDTQLRRPVALKLLQGSLAGARHVLARFRREAEVTSRLDHPGICAVHDTGVADDVAYIAMRFVDGRTLAACIADHRASVEHRAEAASPVPIGSAPGDRTAAVLELFRAAAEALHAAHEAGVVHRDVKPGNLMVTADGRPVLLDFGLARGDAESDAGGGLATLTATGDVFGTPAYMSPEQLRGEHDRIDRRTDVYALGATLYEALTLQPPHAAPNLERLYRAVLADEPSDPRRLVPRLSRDLATVVLTALDKDPRRRYATAAELADELRRVQAHEPIRARAAGPALRAWRWAQRNPAVATLTVGLFAVLVTALVVTTSMNRELKRALDDALLGRASKRARAIEQHVLDGFQRLFSVSPTGADDAFRAAQELDPSNEEALIGRFWLRVASRPTDALALLDEFNARVARTASEDQAARATVAEIEFMRGIVEGARGDVDAANAAYARAGRGRNRDAALRSYLCGLRAVRVFAPPTDPAAACRAIEWFRDAIARASAPRFHYVHSLLKAAHLADRRDVVDEFAIVLEHHWPTAPATWDAIAQFYFGHDDERVATALDRLAHLAPDAASPHLLRAALAFGAGEATVAADHYRAAIAADPRFAVSHLLLGHLLAGTDPAAAATCFEGAIDAGYERSDAWTAWARALTPERGAGGALAAVRAKLATTGSPPQGRLALAELLRDAGAVDEARELLAELAAGTDAVHAALAVPIYARSLRRDLDDPAAVQHALEALIATRPHRASAWRELAIARAAAGDSVGAVEARIEAVRRRPSRANVTALTSATGSPRLESALDELADAHPENAPLRLAIGRRAWRANDVERAREAWREALRLAPHESTLAAIRTALTRDDEPPDAHALATFAAVAAPARRLGARGALEHARLLLAAGDPTGAVSVLAPHAAHRPVQALLRRAVRHDAANAGLRARVDALLGG